MITYQKEDWLPFIQEAKPLLPRHWAELALDKDKVPLDPCYEVYNARDRQNEVLVVTVRNDAKLVGYFIGFIAPGLHYRSCLTCTMDIFYILPEYRGENCGYNLFKAIERECRQRGVNRLFVGSKLHKDVSFLYEKLGYIEVERYYSAWLGG
jgi:GNAT superfamily N-acetyltransferase